MSPKSPRLTGRELIKCLGKHGFKLRRIRGSHHFLAHIDGRATVVPVHRGETIGIGLLGKILKDTELSPNDLVK